MYNKREKNMWRRGMVIAVLCGCGLVCHAQNEKKDSVKVDVTETVDYLYKKILPVLDRVEFNGNGEISRDLQNRWNKVINHLKNNKETMAEDVKDLLVSPSGVPIDLELLKRFIKINEKDSVKKIGINMDFFLDEMKAAANKVTETAKKMAETK